jgi:hypothetical protein
MAVRKYRTFDEARRDLWLPSGDPRILPRLRRLAALAQPAPVVPGVTRFRSIAEAKAGKWASDSPPAPRGSSDA